MRTASVSMCLALTGLSACTGERPTFGKTTPAETPGIDSGLAGDASTTAPGDRSEDADVDSTDVQSSDTNGDTTETTETSEVSNPATDDTRTSETGTDDTSTGSVGSAGLGAACEADTECGSGHCEPSEAGGTICCETPCDDVCSVCSTSGACNAVPADDAACPIVECPSSSACVSYPTEPNERRCVDLGQCADEAVLCVAEFESEGTTCGDGMVCDGLGACLSDCPKETGPERICTNECPCAVGAGTCTDDDQCEAGLVCTANAVAKLGFPGASCLPAHCVNDTRDAEETSVDCGGECGCRATFEVVEITGVPADGSGVSLIAMSGDGSAFAANFGRDRTTYPARIDAEGVLTELQSFGAPGGTHDISADGSVIVGYVVCGDPPDCTSSDGGAYRWTGTGAPEVVYDGGSGRTLVSATGAIVVGEYYDASAEQTALFRVTGAQTRVINALDTITAVSADGLIVAGRLATADEGALWSYQQSALIPLNPPANWSRWEIFTMNADGSAFAGFGYNAELDTYHGYIWRDGEFSELPQLPDADYTMPYAMSASGTTLVGHSGTNDYQRPFIWTEQAGTRHVLDEVRARGLELPVDLELASARFISDDGRIIVGSVPGASTSFWRVTLLD